MCLLYFGEISDWIEGRLLIFIVAAGHRLQYALRKAFVLT